MREGGWNPLVAERRDLGDGGGDDDGGGDGGDGGAPPREGLAEARGQLYLLLPLLWLW